MILILKRDASESDAQRLMRRIEARGLKPLYLPGLERVLVGAVGDDRLLADLDLDADPAVESAKPILSPYKLVSRELRGHDTVVSLGDVSVGGQRIIVIAASESGDALQLKEMVNAVSKVGARALRCGGHRNTVSPYRARRLSPPVREGVAHSAGLASVYSVVDTGELDAASADADCFQVDAYGMHNGELLAALGGLDIPVILNRSPGATPDELLLAAECIVVAGNENVILCEKGSRTLEAREDALDFGSLRYLKERAHLPVVVDLSTFAGWQGAISPLAQAAVACGADGIIIEVLPDPTPARGALSSLQFAQVVSDLSLAAQLAGRAL